MNTDNEEYTKYYLSACLGEDSPWDIKYAVDINDSQTILAYAYNRDTSTYTSVLLMPAEIAVDANRDGTIVLANENPSGKDENDNPVDVTEKDKPYRFWLNDDIDDNDNSDKENDSAYPATSNPDYNDNEIKTKRDLEDFTRLWVWLPANTSLFDEGGLQVAFEWKDLESGQSPKIKIYLSADPDGSDDYRKTEDAAAAQIAGIYKTAVGEVEAGKPLILNAGQGGNVPSDFFTSIDDTHHKKCFIFEGSGAGKGKLVMTFRKRGAAASEEALGSTAPVYLDIKKVTDLYQQVRATPDPINYPQNNQGASTPTSYAPIASNFEKPKDETDQWVLWVHGWNVPDPRYEQQTQATFKRLWWQGFKGRFCSFRWRSYITPGEELGDLQRYAVNGLGYCAIEYRAYIYADALRSYMTNLKSSGANQLYVVAHSMGSVISTEALRPNPDLASGFLIMNGAISASAFDTREELYNNNFPQGKNPDMEPLGIRGQLTNLSPISFYNKDDDATTTYWRVVQLALKKTMQNEPAETTPLLSSGYCWFNSTLSRFVCVGSPQDKHINYREVIDRRESLAFAATSRTRAWGANPMCKGVLRPIIR